MMNFQRHHSDLTIIETLSFLLYLHPLPTFFSETFLANPKYIISFYTLQYAFLWCHASHNV